MTRILCALAWARARMERTDLGINLDEARVTIISTGEELITGRTVDTNAAYIARHLTDYGRTVRRIVVVGDDPDALCRELMRAAEDSAWIAVTGGLGPTADDRTRGAVARAAGLPLERDEASVEHVRRLIESYGHAMTEAHAVQGLFPAGSHILENTCGTARGFICQVGDARVVVMPGVPAEMVAMFMQSVLPRVADQRGARIVVRHVNTCRVPESKVDAALTDLLSAERNPAVGLKVGGGWVAVCIRARGRTFDEADALAEADCRVVEERMGEAVFGRDEQTVAGALAQMLKERGLKLAVAESCTGGQIGSLLTDVPGVSAVFLLDVVAYDNAAKTRLLGVPEEQMRAAGAVSPEVARMMAQGACRACGADVGISTTGIAGPTGGTPDKPVGLLYVGLCLGGRTEVEELKLRGDRRQVKERASVYALDIARRGLLRNPPVCGNR